MDSSTSVLPKMAAASVCIPKVSSNWIAPINPRSVGRSDPESFQITASALGHGTCEIFFVSLKNEVSISQVSWEHVFPAQVPYAGKPHVGVGPLIP